MRSILSACGLLLLAALAVPSASAQSPHHGQHGQPQPPAPGESPYAGLQSRDIKALSAQQLADLRTGQGMGLALAAELNFYPGPRHVLELHEALRLSPEQEKQMERWIAEMTAETSAIGEKIIAAERALDRLFAGKRATRPALDLLTREIGALQAELRAAHLGYHLLTVDALSAEQTQQYAERRGYGGR